MSIAVLSFLNGIVFSLYCILVSLLILQKKQIKLKKIAQAFIPFFLSYYCVLCLFDSVYAIFFSGLISFLSIKIAFEENNFVALLLSLIIHIIKFSTKIIILEILNDNNLLIINTYKSLDLKAFYIILITLIIATIFAFLFRKILRNLVKKVSGSKNREKILLISTYAIFILIIIYQPPYNLTSIKTITDLVIIFIITGLGIFDITTEKKIETLNNHYQEIFEYSKANSVLLNQYKMLAHENKNKLLMIKGMMDGPKKNTIKYIDSILEEIDDNKKNIYYWLTELSHIPFAGVKNFINYKFLKLKDLGAEIEVFVSSDLELIDPSALEDYEYNQLTTILGVILDNMIESISETEKKLISLNIYIEDNKIHSEFVNTFTGKIDLSRLNEVGYTTKGERHGVGLSLLAKIVKMNDRFDCYPKIIDDFFVQHLTIKIYDGNNLQKIAKK